MLLDIDYILLGMPAIAISLWAQWRICSTRLAASRLPASSGLTGAEAALRLMQASGVGPVEIMPAAGQLSNHYDPSRRVLRLSQSVHAGRSLAALAIAVHEAGHATPAGVKVSRADRSRRDRSDRRTWGRSPAGS